MSKSFRMKMNFFWPGSAIVTPRSARASIETPYSISDFSESKHFMQVPPSKILLQAKEAAKIRPEKVEQFQGGRISYFEQGLIVGAAIGSVTIIALGFLSFRAFRAYALGRV